MSDELGAAGGVRDVLGGVAGAPPARGRASSDAGGSGVSALLGKARKGRIPQNYSFDDLALKVYGDAARAPAAPRGLMGGAPGGGGGGMPSGSGGESATSTVGGSAPRRSGQRTWIVFEPSGTVRRYTADRHRQHEEGEEWSTLWPRLEALGWRHEDGKRVGTDNWYFP